MEKGSVERQLASMISFIKCESEDKARELKVKATEEADIERQRVVQGEKRRLKEEYERRRANLETNRRIQRSNELNQARLKVLRAREEALDKIVKQTTERLVEVSKDEAQYKKLLTGLIVQAADTLNESKLVVRSREQDVNVVKSVLSDATSQLKATKDKQCEFSVDETEFLPIDGPEPVHGGVVVMIPSNRVLVNNTTDRRLLMVYEALLPAIRGILFDKEKASA